MNNINEALDFHSASTCIIIGDHINFKFILSQNPTLLSEKEFGETLLHIAADNSQYEIAEFLLSLGQNPDIQNDSGESPLHLAIFRSSKRIINLLLSHKANPNILNKDHKSPLHYAAEYKDPEAIKGLLLHGASPTLMDINNMTPIDLADDLACLFPQRYPMPMISEVSPTEELISTINSLEHSTIKAGGFDYRVKTKRHSFKEELFDFLSSISLDKHYKSMVSSGFDNLQGLLLQMKTQNPVSHKVLKSIGIEKSGDRSKIIVNLFKFSVETESNQEFATVYGFLDEIDLTCYYKNFLDCGFDNIVFLFENANNGKGLSDEILQNKVGIYKTGHRMRIVSAIEYYSAKHLKNSSRCFLF
ncbi:hypothetical protein SteCoe_34342 [Stentor coeruleus]|uniref:SAM domain-containing protein n=1 Tax=Stentor coeruleus TaxID=5963 RepID=A0A1R2AV32_9CILI|nr:hypothetical protein SteCoe_34342 [Stentor coeruleus]